MIYSELQIAPAGDRHLLATLGDDASLEVNFVTLNFTAELDKLAIDGLTDLVPSYNSILVQYDFNRLGYDDLRDELIRIYKALPSFSELEIASRLVTIPVLYFDPWTKDCIEDYRRKVAEREYDPLFVARVNNLCNPEEVVARHTGCEQWVVTVSSFPGLPILRPLDPRCELLSPKYNPPRTWTPVGAIGVGGTSTSIYTIPSPGGYNLIGRTPVPVWDPSQALPAFKDSAILLRASDRVRFASISREEYDHIVNSVREKSYAYAIEPGVFSVSTYRTRLAALASGAVAEGRRKI
jgi:urea carboxylase